MLKRWILTGVVSFLAVSSVDLFSFQVSPIDQPAIHLHATTTHGWQINTHNKHKLKELTRLFAKYDQTFSYTEIDLHEIDSDPVSVTAHKASQMGEYVLVEDTSLDVEGAEIGVNLRWKKDELNSNVGKKAIWRVILAYRVADCIYVYKGEVNGRIVEPRGPKSYGFNSIFQPDGETKTLAEFSSDKIDARAIAVDAFMRNRYSEVVKAIYRWDGPWQNEKKHK